MKLTHFFIAKFSTQIGKYIKQKTVANPDINRLNNKIEKFIVKKKMKLQKQLIVIIPQIKYLLLTILITNAKIKEPNKEPKPYAVPKLPIPNPQSPLF